MEMTQQINIQMVIALNEWDPFGCGEGNYDTEVEDSVQAVHLIDDKEKLARKLQSIYEFSFEEIIPLESCLKMAAELLAIKNQGSCSI